MSDVVFARTLAAVLAADVVGYSRLMQLDEDATMAAWWSYRREIVDPAVEANRGRIVKLTGDGFLAEFPSVSDSVAAAVAIQSEIAERVRDVPEDRRVQFRIGINLGDILKDDEDIYGDGVNLAARIKALAEPGGIWVSSSVREQLRHRSNIQLEDMGEHELKNMADPVRTFRVVLESTSAGDANTAAAETPVTDAGAGAVVAALTAAQTAPPLPSDPDRPSIAVLPFNNMGSDPEQDYFADGITEDLITELSRFQDLLVIARNTVFTYRGTAVKVQDVGRDLNVAYVLEGSVRKAGDRVRIAAQLIDAKTGHHVWADRFDRTLEDIFAVQDEVVQKIVATMSVKLSESERTKVRDGGDKRAYDLVLKGRDLWRKFTPEDNAEARRLYEQAIELDPSYGRAFASLAWTHMMDASERWTDDVKTTMELALDAAVKGIHASPDSHTNFGALGQVYLSLGRHSEALDALRRSIALNPNDPDSYGLCARALAYSGKPGEALEEMDKGRAITLNPPDWFFLFEGAAHYINHDYEKAVETLRRHPSPAAASQRWLAISNAQAGHKEAAREAAEEYLRRTPDFDFNYQLMTEPFENEADRNHYAECMKKAGLAGIGATSA